MYASKCIAESEIMLNSKNNLMADYTKYLITPKKSTLTNASAETLIPKLILLYWISDFVKHILKGLTSKLEDNCNLDKWTSLR